MKANESQIMQLQQSTNQAGGGVMIHQSMLPSLDNLLNVKLSVPSGLKATVNDAL